MKLIATLLIVLACSTAGAADHVLNWWGQFPGGGGGDPDAPVAAAGEIPQTCIVLVTQPNCPPCDRAKETIVPWVEASGWEVVERDVRNAAEWDVNATPTLIVLRSGNERGRYTGANLRAFERVLRDACDCRAATGSRPGPAELGAWANAYTGRQWYVRGQSERQHLIDEHGFQAWQIEGLNTTQLRRLHGAAHDGRIDPSRPLPRQVTYRRAG